MEKNSDQQSARPPNADQESELKALVEDMVEDAMDDQLDEKEPRVTIWKRIQTSIMMIAALMISAGQFNDTKEIFTSLYETTLANFTHAIEYELIDKIHVGSSLVHVKSIVGEPHVVKRSKINPDIRFYYYSKDKFNLTLLTADERLVGYSIFTQQDDFSPQLPFAEELGAINLANSIKQSGSYSFDIGNLIYYIESQDLGKQQMFLTLVRGYVEYGAVAVTENVTDNYGKTVSDLISELDHQATFAENDEDLLATLNKVKTAIYPNFYAITELDAVIIAEALLTRYEYQMFTQS